MQVNVTDALDHLIGELAKIPAETGLQVSHDQRPYGCEVYLPWIVDSFWAKHGIVTRNLRSSEQEPHYRPFYDAAWELCRIGVLRPGQVAPAGIHTGSGMVGDGYSLTAYGRQWIHEGEKRPLTPTDPERFAQVLQPFSEKFGTGFHQRAMEAVGCYRTNRYLACCVMAGAAAESVLLATAITKVGNESQVLNEYRAASGRRKVIERITHNLPGSIVTQFKSATNLLSYWRDEAAHGSETTISEAEAHSSLGQLLRLAQFTSDHWAELTGRNLP